VTRKSSSTTKFSCNMNIYTFVIIVTIFFGKLRFRRD
jgi:hypothetical protein